jgi:thiol-disulfide isomerase/thioredoxin
MRLRIAALLAAVAFVIAGASAVYYASSSPANGTKGREVPDLQFQDGTGRTHSLAEFRGRVVLLNIWATWCAPCREEMPALDRLEAKLGGPDFDVVALSIDRQGTEVVRKFFADVGVKSLRIYIDPSAQAMSRVGAVGVPMTLLIDQDGREIGRRAGPAKWDAARSIEDLRRLISGVG